MINYIYPIPKDLVKEIKNSNKILSVVIASWIIAFQGLQLFFIIYFSVVSKLTHCICFAFEKEAQVY